MVAGAAIALDVSCTQVPSGAIARVGLPSGGKLVAKVGLTLCPDKPLVAKAFHEWRSILEAGSEPVGWAFQLVGTDVRFRRIMRQKVKMHLDFWIGSSEHAAVQLNEPGAAGSENPGTTIALDQRGRRYLVRQGDLHGNPPSLRIRNAEFSRRTGSQPVAMSVAGHPARKEWHVVTRLDGVSEAVIRARTAEFVRRCWNARAFGKQAGRDQGRVKKLFGSGERGSWFDLDPALQPRRVLRVQGYVYECLETLLHEFGIEIQKPRHAANYEVDGTISTHGGPLLLEIKTGVSAADVYCGVGQLTVYPVILPDLAAHARVLLLPGEPTTHLVQALRTCGVELHRYELKRGRRRATAVFSADFLRRCGVPEKELKHLIAKGKALA